MNAGIPALANAKRGTAIQAEGGTAEERIGAGLAHAFGDEPGINEAPQGAEARAVDRLAGEWFVGQLG